MSQKKYLEDYATRNGFTNIRHFTDDGYTGRNFNRPGFQELLAEVHAGNVGVIIVKDMSRLGRNYLQVGFYTEILFPEKEIHFIAINNSVDSENGSDNDFTPFLNIMNEWYARDTSNKIKSIFNSRMADGKRCSGSIPFGYNRMPGDKQTLVVDPVASLVVKRIFDMADTGMSPTQIAKQLQEEQVLIPSAYTAKFHPEQNNGKRYFDPYGWSNTTVNAMKICPKCQTPSPADKTFCPNCGTKLPDETLAEGAVCPQCGKQNTIGTKFCSSCGAKLPFALAEEKAEAEKNAAVLAKWAEKLSQYPVWNCGGTDFELEEGEDWFRFAASFDTEAEGEQSIPAYRALLKANGFREAGQYPDKAHLYKKIDGKCYHVDTEHCFEGSMERPEIWFNIQEPSGGFDYVKPEPKKGFSFGDLFK